MCPFQARAAGVVRPVPNCPQGLPGVPHPAKELLYPSRRVATMIGYSLWHQIQFMTNTH